MSDDSRWSDDPRDREDGSGEPSRGSRGGSDARERDQVDPRDVFLEHVDLPRGPDREHVHAHDHDYTLRGSEARTLTTVGAFRVVLQTTCGTSSTIPSTHAMASCGTSGNQGLSTRFDSTATPPSLR
jgi:hypothetical protein